MATQMFAFVRAINTGGRRLTNEQVIAPFVTLGLHDVAAYQAAGNVAFVSDRDPSDLDAELTEALAAAYGFDAPTFVRTRSELVDALLTPPFDAGTMARTEGRTQITFMGSAPTDEQIAQAMALVPADDHVVFHGREWFWLPQAGISGSALPVTRVERIVGPMTMRTVGTVERMLAKFVG